MSALGEEIAALIAAEGPISVERYMALALGHPAHGYYMQREPFGAAGDFVTAPEISQMFGELIGLWAAQTWSQLGAPPSIKLVELGPGRGTLMQDALRAARVSQEFFASLDVHLIETSPRLRALQEERLRASGLPIRWHADLSELPDGPAIFLANEFFDALPIRQYICGEGGWRERSVGLSQEGGLCFGLSPRVETSIGEAARPGAVLEFGVIGYQLMGALAKRIVAQGGAMLAIDYGYLATGLGETLQAVRGHRYVDPLEEPGLSDLTAHVDFSALALAAAAQGLVAQGPVTQARFLTELGIDHRAQALKARASPEQSATIDAALARLTQADGGMGDLFKAIAFAEPGAAPLPGFARENGES